MEIWFTKEGGTHYLASDMNQWVMDKAGAIGAKEFSNLTDRAAQGPHFQVTKSLRVNTKDLTVALVKEFRLRKLTETYENVLPNVETFFKAIIGKENITAAPGSRNVDDVWSATVLRVLRS
jgi:hypothetical protein